VDSIIATGSGYLFNQENYGLRRGVSIPSGVGRSGAGFSLGLSRMLRAFVAMIIRARAYECECFPTWDSSLSTAALLISLLDEAE
jgi:hypothetical protein